MAKPKKYVDLHAKEQRVECRCQHCGQVKTLRYKRHGKLRRLYGATEKPLIRESGNG